MIWVSDSVQLMNQPHRWRESDNWCKFLNLFNNRPVKWPFEINEIHLWNRYSQSLLKMVLEYGKRDLIWLHNVFRKKVARTIRLSTGGMNSNYIVEHSYWLGIASRRLSIPSEFHIPYAENERNISSLLRTHYEVVPQICLRSGDCKVCHQGGSGNRHAPRITQPFRRDHWWISELDQYIPNGFHLPCILHCCHPWFCNAGLTLQSGAEKEVERNHHPAG